MCRFTIDVLHSAQNCTRRVSAYEYYKFRQALIEYSLKYGVTKAAIRCKTNRQYIYRRRKRYDGTLQSLADKSHKPHHHPNEHTPDELKLIENMRKRNPNAGLVVFVEHLIKKFPFKIECVQTDNGQEFTKKLGSSKTPTPTMFEAALEQHNIKHKLIRPYTPRHNGKVERSHRKDNEYFYATHTFYCRFTIDLLHSTIFCYEINS